MNKKRKIFLKKKLSEGNFTPFIFFFTLNPINCQKIEK